MTLYIGAWVLAEVIAIGMFIFASKSGVASIPAGRFAWWAVAYPVLIGWNGWEMIGEMRAQGNPLLIDCAFPAFLTVIGVVLTLAVRAYARNPGE